MATTSDKRREVAQRLREADAERSVPHPIEWYEEHGTADLFATLNACLGTCGLADEMRHPLARLADLIDEAPALLLRGRHRLGLPRPCNDLVQAVDDGYAIAHRPLPGPRDGLVLEAGHETSGWDGKPSTGMLHVIAQFRWVLLVPYFQRCRTI